MMKARSLKLVFAATVAIWCVGGCQKKQNENDAIREAVKQHLVSLRTLNLQAMDMDFTNISIQDTRATAQVSFRLKGAAATGPAMQVAYQLEKQNGAWGVLKTAAMGGMIEHPAPGTNPHLQGNPGDSHGGLPNFKELVTTPGSDTAGALPPGHPAVPASTPQAQPK